MVFTSYVGSISIHALREEGDALCELDAALNKISIHALREEGDADGVASRLRKGISIHALREEGDSPILGIQYSHARFLSTPSARRATQNHSPAHWPIYISIHALREEGDMVGPR